MWLCTATRDWDGMWAEIIATQNVISNEKNFEETEFYLQNDYCSHASEGRALTENLDTKQLLYQKCGKVPTMSRFGGSRCSVFSATLPRWL